MKTFYFLIVFCCCHFLSYSQLANNRRNNPEQPILFTPKSHDPNFLKSAQFPEKSFYQRKSEWKQIIDTTWGPGAPLEEKLKIFNTYAKAIHDKFDGIGPLKLNWDSLYNHYFCQINDSTSKGAFTSIMSHFAFEFKDAHTNACDSTIINTALNPGIPVLITSSFMTIEHFGAVTTILPDSTTLVIRVVPDHPLNLEPGDIILGYEGVPWKYLIKELYNAGLPVYGITGGCNESNAYHHFSRAGMNWHLFSTIDILKYSTGDTLHLSLKPMVAFDVNKMVNNEQLTISNIPFPKPLPYPYISDTLVTFGKLENTNIGYIYLSSEYPYETSNNQFNAAVDSLKNTDALIIDMRMNIGGWALFETAFNILFNEFHLTLKDLIRCNINTFNLCDRGNAAVFQINGKDPDHYDRPIAILLGPTCVSMGDVTAYRLSYHPMVRFFGQSSTGSLGDNSQISLTGWYLNYSFTNMCLVNEPENYLNRKKFPIDFPVWFNKDDVAKGIDPIVEKAKEWINKLSYGHSLGLNKSFFLAYKDTLIATATIENPESHELIAKLIIESMDSSFIDSTELKPVDLEPGQSWQGTFVTDHLAENYYWLSLKVEDKTKGTSFTNRHMTKFTTVPLVIDTLEVTKNADYNYSIRPTIRNAGDSVTIQQTISVSLSTNPWVKTITPKTAFSNSLLPGQVKKLTAFKLTGDTATFQNHFDLKFTVASQGWPYWLIETTVTVPPTAISDNLLLPLTNSLDQNYPNPFNSQTTISWHLAKGERVTISVFNILGSKVATLVDEYRPAGKYETFLNASTLPKGIYFYQLKAGKFIQTRKMMVGR